MKIRTLFTILVLILVCNNVWVAGASETKSEVELSRIEKHRIELAQERAREKNKFKKRAIENTIKREKKHIEMLKEKQERESRFQKKAREDELREREEMNAKEKNEVK